MSNDEEVVFKRTVLIIGNNECGKTSLLNVFKSGVFSEAYIPSKPSLHPNALSEHTDISKVPKSPPDEKASHFKVQGKRVDFTLRDTNGNEDEEVFNALLHEAHVVLICFGVGDPGSLEDTRTKWSTKIAESGATPPTILVACKSDLRSDEQTIERLKKTERRPVPKFEGVAIAQKLKPPAKFYVECSSKNDDGVTDVFTKAAEVCIPEFTLDKRKQAKWRETKMRIFKALIFVLMFSLLYYIPHDEDMVVEIPAAIDLGN
ncbi:rho1 gtpase [Moniliophthora roreri MCA 2997]|uniref:Rho1 gtpase n=2 Tax=Moniliophthora roreri TaxID=221103 RepID=V2XAX4_MONRO|nr:rho1 gtpase [Moniliophthora roreri MCA 2997]KAI3604676.1 rho1 gtpase [Moniliophthora roreri]